MANIPPKLAIFSSHRCYFAFTPQIKLQEDVPPEPGSRQGTSSGNGWREVVEHRVCVVVVLPLWAEIMICRMNVWLWLLMVIVSHSFHLWFLRFCSIWNHPTPSLVANCNKFQTFPQHVQTIKSPQCWLKTAANTSKVTPENASARNLPMSSRSYPIFFAASASNHPLSLAFSNAWGVGAREGSPHQGVGVLELQFFLLRSKDDLLVKHMVADYHLIYLIHSNNVIVIRIEWQQYDSAWSHDSKGTWLCHL